MGNFNLPPPGHEWIAAFIQILAALVCAGIIYRLAAFLIERYREARAKSEEVVWPALGISYTLVATVLISANIWFLPNFSASVLAALPILDPSKRLFVYLTHSIVVAAFIINYANSVETYQELEYGRYGKDADWGKLINGRGSGLQSLDAAARLAIGVCFVWLESNLWLTGSVNLVDRAVTIASSDAMDQSRYRQMLGGVADAAFATYLSLAIWVAITIIAALTEKEGTFRGENARRAIVRQVMIIVSGFLISSYSLFLARGDAVLFQSDFFPQSLDVMWVFAFALLAAVVGLFLCSLIVTRLLNDGAVRKLLRLSAN